ncbi:hypothetical protein CARUB_v10016339mg, partial [Capsella rubella]
NQHCLLANALRSSEEWLYLQQARVTEGSALGLCSSSVSHRWCKPATRVLKCNVHCSWINDSVFFGDVMFHARDAFTPKSNRIAAKLCCILWCLKSLKDLHIVNCEVWSDCNAALSALAAPVSWPKYRSLLEKIASVIKDMGEIRFMVSLPKANSIARDIAKSVTADGRWTSYLALGGPAWLHNRINQE